MTTSCSDTTKTDERSHFLRVKEQRTMLLLFSSLRFELCNSIGDSSQSCTDPDTETHTKSIVQTVHLDSAPTGSHFPLLVFLPSSFFVFSLCVHLKLALISRPLAANVVFVGRSWRLCFGAGPEFNTSVPHHMRGFCAWNWRNKSDHTSP